MGGKPRKKPEPSPKPPRMKGSKQSQQFYVVRLDDNQTFAFVQHPDAPGYFMKTDISVALTECYACNSPKGVPCTGSYGDYTVGTHCDRKGLCKPLRRAVKRHNGFILTGKERIIFARDL